MGHRQHIEMSVMVSVILFMCIVNAIDPLKEKLLMGLENSEVSVFAKTDYQYSSVYNLEIDQYKTGFVIYSERYAMKTSNGKITETIAGNPSQSGYIEGVGASARFHDIRGFTQISATKVIVSDYNSYCLRQLDRVNSVTSEFAGKCKTLAFQDDSLAYPENIIVDKKNPKQLFVAIVYYRAIATVDVESRHVGTFFKSDQHLHVIDMIQDSSTGNVYFIGINKLYEISYNTRSLTDVFNQNGLPGLYPRLLLGLDNSTILFIDGGGHIGAFDRTDNIVCLSKVCPSVYSTPETEDFKHRHECGLVSGRKVLLTNDRLLTGNRRQIRSYKPIINHQQTKNQSTRICRSSTLQTGTTTPISSTSSPTPSCEARNITAHTDLRSKTAKIKLPEGSNYVDLPEGSYTYETFTAQNQTCITRVNVIDNTTSVTKQPLTCPEKVVALTSPESSLASFKLQFGDQKHVIRLPLGSYSYSMKSSNKDCNISLMAEDYRVRRRLELVADYNVDCSSISQAATKSLLEGVAQQQYTIIEALCGSACKKPADDKGKPVISCENTHDLKIRWPTSLVFTAEVVGVPTNISQAIESRIRSPGVTLHVVVFGASPPVVYPKKVAKGGFVSIALTSFCVDGFIYSKSEQKCVQV